jgi:hypothetical protein
MIRTIIKDLKVEFIMTIILKINYVKIKIIGKVLLIHKKLFKVN